MGLRQMQAEIETKGANIAVDSPMIRMNAVRIITVLFIAFGYASTMPVGPGSKESLALLGFEPSWIGIQVLFFLSGVLALKSLQQDRAGWTYIKSKMWRILPQLSIVTLIVTLVIFPLLGHSDESMWALSGRLAKYFALTVMCIDPGAPLPGLMDDAKYMCLIQGAIWTFKFGLLLHVGTAIAGKIGLHKSKRFLLLAAVLMTFFYAGLFYYDAINKYASSTYNLIELTAKLAYPFLLGMAFWAYREKVSASRYMKGAILVFLLGYTVISQTWLKWTPFIDISLCIFWMYIAWLVAISRTKLFDILDNWPNIVLGLYIINWPVSQVLVETFPSFGRWTLPFVTLPITILLAYVLQKGITFKFKPKMQIKLGREIPVKTAAA